MMIDAPMAKASLAVIPERPDLSNTAYWLANRLRSSNFAVEFPFSGNAKKRVEKAKKAGAFGFFFVNYTDSLSSAVPTPSVRFSMPGFGEEHKAEQVDVIVNRCATAFDLEAQKTREHLLAGTPVPLRRSVYL